MKVGILTFVKISNYGALLQAYGLQTAIEKCGANAELLNYYGPMYQKGKVPLVSKINGAIKSALVNISGGIRREKEYKERHLNLSKEFTPESIAQANDEYDKFIVGSDQVWNMDLVKGDRNFLLEFVNDNKKKNSYAASIGGDKIVERYHDIVGELLRGFGGMITVREKTAQKLLQEEFGISSKVVLDPTLLLGKDDWSKVAVMPKMKKEYIVIYQMGRSKTLIKAAAEDAKRSNMQLVSLKPSLDNLICGKNCYGAGPAEFVGWFLGASKVYTNSFHGTAFAVNFNKDLHVEFLKKGNVNSRIGDFLNGCRIKHRTLGTEPYDAEMPIDFDQVNALLNDMRKESNEVLRKMVGGSNIADEGR